MPRPASPPLLTPGAARALHLAAQGLLLPPSRVATPDDLLAAIRRMQLLQIDTIQVVARSPYLVLFSRLGAYPPVWLEQLLEQGRIFETWAHEACFAATADWPVLRAALRDKSGHWAIRSADRAHARDAAGMSELLEQIRRDGPVRSADFRRVPGSAAGGWWAWSDEKRWLEAWFARGALMVARRERFQRVYDLSERVLAGAGIDLARVTLPDPSSTRLALIERSVHALGVAPVGWLADYFRLDTAVRVDELAPLLADGRLLTVQVRGWDEPAYVHADHAQALGRAVAGRLRAQATTVLSPFDPVVWDRGRALALFDFDYRLECYTPAAQRRFGYFVLPILHRGRLVGRLDAKAHRRDRLFEIRRLELAASSTDRTTLVAPVAAAIARCARWHGADQATLAAVDGRGLIRPMRTALRAAMAAEPAPQLV
jgi:uncharacterized protein YcaQ